KRPEISGYLLIRGGRPFERGWRRRSLRSGIGGKGCCLVPGLDVLDLVEIVGREKLRADHTDGKLRRNFDDALDALRDIAFPARAGDQEVTPVVAVHPRAEIV